VGGYFSSTLKDGWMSDKLKSFGEGFGLFLEVYILY